MSNVIKLADWKAKKISGLSVNNTRVKRSAKKARKRLYNACVVLGALQAFPKSKQHERFFIKTMGEFMLGGRKRDEITKLIIDYIEKHKKIMEKKIGKRITINFDDKRACKRLRRKINSLCERKYPEY